MAKGWTGQTGQAEASPIGFPDMDGILISDVMLLCLLIQEIKEVLDCGWHRMPRRQHALEEVVHKLLQCALWRTAAWCDPAWGTLEALGCRDVFL